MFQTDIRSRKIFLPVITASLLSGCLISFDDDSSKGSRRGSCSEGTTRCVAYDVEMCVEGQWQWINSCDGGDEFGTTICREFEGGVHACDYVGSGAIYGCEPNETLCLGNSLQTCISNEFVTTVPCTNLGELCVTESGIAECQSVDEAYPPVFVPDDDGEPGCSGASCYPNEALCSTICGKLTECYPEESTFSSCYVDCLDEIAADIPSDSCRLAAGEYWDCLSPYACSVLEGDTAVCTSEQAAANTYCDEGSTGGAPGGWTCEADFYGTDDGCDCGCGVTDPDCESTSASVCDFNNCPTGQAPYDFDNSFCITP